jgi:hypothetical protein
MLWLYIIVTDSSIMLHRTAKEILTLAVCLEVEIVQL